MISFAIKFLRLALLPTVASGARFRKIVIDAETALSGDSTHFHFISGRHRVSPGSLIQSQFTGAQSSDHSANQSQISPPDQSILHVAPEKKQRLLQSSVDRSANQSQVSAQDQSTLAEASEMKWVNLYRGELLKSSVDRSANQSAHDQSILPGTSEMKRANLYRGPLLQSSLDRSANQPAQDQSILPETSEMKQVSLYRAPLLQSSVDRSANQSPQDQPNLPGTSEMKRVNLYRGPLLQSSAGRSINQSQALPQDQSVLPGSPKMKQVATHRGTPLQSVPGLPEAMPSRVEKTAKSIKKGEGQSLLQVTAGEAGHDHTKASITPRLGSLIASPTLSHDLTQEFNISPLAAYKVSEDHSMSQNSFEEIDTTAVVDYVRAGFMVLVVALIAVASMTRYKAAVAFHKEGPRLEPTVPLSVVNKTEYLENCDVESFLQCPENKYCADCRAPGAEWASVNLGIFLCIECAGVHRGLGVRISRVQSLDMDDWKDEWINTCRQVGNRSANDYYEHGDVGNLRFEHGMSSGDPKHARHLRELWIRSKYEYKAFVPDDMV